MLGLNRKYSDSQIIDGIRRRENKVFEYIDNEYKESIRIHIMSNSGDSDDADDIYQDCIERLIQKVDNYDFKLTCKFKTLLFSICKRKWLRVLEKKQAEQNYHIRKNVPDEPKEITEVMDCRLYNGIFWDSFNKLQDDCKRLLKSCMKEIPIKEIADILDYTYGYIRRKKCLCHEFFADQIINHPEYKEIKSKEGRVKLY